MKASIDLTEDRAFDGNGTKLPKRYPHKLLPWISAGEFESAKLKDKNDIAFSKSYSSDDQTITWKYLFEESGSYHLSTISTINDNKYYYSNSSYNNIYYNTTDYVDWITLENMSGIKPKIFPTGRKKEIKLRRAKEKDKYLEYRKKFCKCTKCGRLISNVPWNKKYFKMELCEDDSKNTVFKINHRWKNNESFRFIGMPDSEVYCDIPCISKRIPKINKERKFPKKYNCLIYYSGDRSFLKKHIKETKRVYFKGIKNLRIMFGEPWQPKGRIVQEYDEIFDNISWRDLLRKRIGDKNGK